MRLIPLACLVICTSLVDSNLHDHQKDAEWIQYKSKHRKSYGLDEDRRRYIHFTDRMQLIKEHNKRYQTGEVKYHKRINAWSDYSVTDLHHLHGFKPRHGKAPSHKLMLGKSPVTAPPPSSVDWRQKGAVTGVKNQGKCGACWAFSTTGAIEGQVFVQVNKLVSFSEQELVDCSTENAACDGGNYELAFDFLKEHGGLEEETSYSYSGKKGQCSSQTLKEYKIKLKNYYQVLPGDENELKRKVAEVGPISVAITVTQSFYDYGGGIFEDYFCNDAEVNHAVLLVGYGSENGTDYWLVKNSWGPDWGENGYIRMSRNKDNQCNIAKLAVYPKLEAVYDPAPGASSLTKASIVVLLSALFTMIA